MARHAMLALLVLAGCQSRTEILIGIATDVRAPDILDAVQLRVLRGKDGVIEQDLPPWTITGIPTIPFNLPGSYGVNSSEGTEVKIAVELIGLKGGSEVIKRTALVTLVHGKTLFMRMGLVAGCMNRSACSPGQTCVEGTCVDPVVDSAKLPEFKLELVDHVSCMQGAHFIDTSTCAGAGGCQAMPATADAMSCPMDLCSEGTCLKPTSSDGGMVAPWKPQVTPRLGVALNAAWGSAQSGYDVFVVGDQGTILHLTGGAPTAASSFVDESPAGVGTSLRAVSGTSGNDVWAVGDAGVVLHRDATGWHAGPAGISADLAGIVATGSSQAVVVGTASGAPLVAQLTPTQSTTVAFSGTQGLTAISGTPTILVAADAAGGTWISPASTIVFTQGPGHATAPLRGIWVDGASSRFFAVGDGGNVLLGPEASGGASAGVAANLRAVWGSSASDVYAVGDGGTIVHFDGQSWTAQPSGASGVLGAVFGTSGGDVFAAGAMATVLHSTGNGMKPPPPVMCGASGQPCCGTPNPAAGQCGCNAPLVCVSGMCQLFTLADNWNGTATSAAGTSMFSWTSLVTNADGTFHGVVNSTNNPCDTAGATERVDGSLATNLTASFGATSSSGAYTASGTATLSKCGTQIDGMFTVKTATLVQCIGQSATFTMTPAVAPK